MSNHPGIFRKETKSGPRYQVKFRDSQNVQKARNFRTVKEAKAFKAEVESSKARGILVDEQLSKTTFRELAERVEKLKSNQRPTSIARRRHTLDKYLFPRFGEVRVCDIRSSHIEDVIQEWRDDKGLSSNTIRIHVSVLNPVFERAVRDGIINRNPVRGVPLPPRKHNQIRVLSPDECQALIDATRPGYRVVIQIALGTGMRIGELLGLKIGDLNVFAKTLTVADSKTEAGIREVLVGSEEISLINDHLRSTGRTGANPDQPLFVGPRGNQVKYSDFRRRVFIPACEAAGLAEVRIHDLRRTHATMLVYQGFEAPVVQQRLGHKEISTTYKHYVGVSDERRSSAAGAMSRYMKHVDHEAQNLPEANSRVEGA